MTVKATKPDRKIGGKTLDEWDDEWVEMPGGFAIPHDDLHYVIGIFRADLNGKTQVIGYGVDFEQGGLFKRLQTLRSPILQTGNTHKAANFIRANINDLTLHVIKTGTGAGSELITKTLCREMRKRYGIQRGEIPVLIRL